MTRHELISNINIELQKLDDITLEVLLNISERAAARHADNNGEGRAKGEDHKPFDRLRKHFCS